MKKLINTLSVLAVLSTPAFADVTVTTGRPGGSYYGVQGPKIVKFLKGVGVTASFVESSGSLDNLSKVAKGESQIGIAQADAIMFFKRTNPQLGTKIEIGGSLGRECVFIVAKKGGKVNFDDDLQVKGVSIAAGSPGDGSRATWDYMGMLEDKFKNPTIIDVGGASGLAQTATGTASAFIFVTNPDPMSLFSNELFLLTRGNKSLQFVPIADWNLNDKLPNGDAVFTYDKVVIKPGTLVDEKLSTICLNTYTVYNSDLDADTKEKLSRAFLRMGASEDK